MNDTDIIKDVLKMIKEDGIDQLVEAIKPALEEARADEREKIRNILNDGLLHSNEEAINRLIDYLRKNETSFDFFFETFK